MEQINALAAEFGILPASVTLWNGGPTRAPIETQVRFALELWRVENGFELRHGHQKLALFVATKLCSGSLLWMSPAKGPGFSGLGYCDGSSQLKLLEGRFEDLAWMRATAQKLGRALGVKFWEHDGGGDC